MQIVNVGRLRFDKEIRCVGGELKSDNEDSGRHGFVEIVIADNEGKRNRAYGYLIEDNEEMLNWIKPGKIDCDKYNKSSISSIKREDRNILYGLTFKLMTYNNKSGEIITKGTDVDFNVKVERDSGGLSFKDMDNGGIYFIDTGRVDLFGEISVLYVGKYTERYEIAMIRELGKMCVLGCSIHNTGNKVEVCEEDENGELRNRRFGYSLDVWNSVMCDNILDTMQKYIAKLANNE